MAVLGFAALAAGRVIASDCELRILSLGAQVYNETSDVKGRSYAQLECIAGGVAGCCYEVISSLHTPTGGPGFTSTFLFKPCGSIDSVPQLIKQITVPVTPGRYIMTTVFLVVNCNNTDDTVFLDAVNDELTIP